MRFNFWGASVLVLLGLGCVGSELGYDRSPPKKNDLLESKAPPSPQPSESTDGTPAQSEAPALEFLSGDLKLSDGSTVALDSLKAKPLVLLFAAEFCNVCKKEHENLIAQLRDPAVEPDRVRFVTMVVAMTPEDSSFWKEDRQVPWQVGGDENLELIDRICGVRQTPCTVIQTPERGIVLKRRGEITPDEIRQWGGEWYE